jgi:hypothetical protein
MHSLSPANRTMTYYAYVTNSHESHTYEYMLNAIDADVKRRTDTENLKPRLIMVRSSSWALQLCLPL